MSDDIRVHSRPSLLTRGPKVKRKRMRTLTVDERRACRSLYSVGWQVDELVKLYGVDHSVIARAIDDVTRYERLPEDK